MSAINKLVGVTAMYTNGQAPMRLTPTQTSRKIMDVPPGAVVIHTGRTEPGAIEYMEIDYATHRGWVYSGYLDPYIESLPKDCVKTDLHTPDASDPEQFVHYNGARQVNMCGQFCAAYVLGIPLEMVLDKWEQKQPTLWTRIFGRKNGAKVAGGTSPADLIALFSAFDLKAKDLTAEMTDPILKRSRYTTSRLASLTKSKWVIASVNIDGGTGRLRGAGVLHWVVVNAVQDERIGYGGVEIYNPFPNRIEYYSWTEWIASARQPYGVIVDGNG